MADWTADIRATYGKLERSYKSRDFDTVASVYTEDCIFMPPGSKLARGRDVSVSTYKPIIAAGGNTITFNTEELIPNADTATERGHFVFHRADGTVFDTGKYITLWKREGGEAKIFADIWNGPA